MVSRLAIIKLDYAWLESVAVVSEKNVIDILPGMSTTSIYLADINHDQKYEVCTTNNVGSGIIDSRIHVLDVQNHQIFSLTERMKTNLYLSVNKNGDLIVYGSPWGKPKN